MMQISWLAPSRMGKLLKLFETQIRENCLAQMEYLEEMSVKSIAWPKWNILIPKVDSPRHPGDLRPISSAINVYKIIMRIILVRLKGVIAFIPCRSISDNGLLSKDLVWNFHLWKGSQRMCLQLDLSKAFDSVKWGFLEEALRAFNFPEIVIS